MKIQSVFKDNFIIDINELNNSSDELKKNLRIL